MSDRKTETIDIGRGVKYAKVASRLEQFHGDNTECHVETHCEFKEGHALFSAKVTTKKGTFTGHSLAKVTLGQKQFEKQETIAVGRALAFAGYLSSGDIACQEEMDDLRRIAGVTFAQLNTLKTDWLSRHAEDLKGRDQAAIGKAFAEWVQKVLGDGGPDDVGDFRKWTAGDLEKCQEALG